MRLSLLGLVTVAFLSTAAQAQENWPRFRGPNEDGNTALHIASFFANAELVELLLRTGASVSIKNSRGETPLDVVSADWSPQLEQMYSSIGDLVGIELDLARIKQARPKVARLLREHAAEADDLQGHWNSLT